MSVQLYPYQEGARDKLLAALTMHGVALDASDTGVGKTYVALGVAKKLGLKPLVITPKSVVSAWKSVAKQLGVEPIDVINIEKLKTGNTEHLKRADQGTGKRKRFIWTLPPGTLVIVDECHVMSGRTSDNSKVLAATRLMNYKVLLLSATVADSPLKMRAIGFLLGLHKYKDFSNWCLKNGCFINLWGGLDYSKKHAEKAMKELHKQIFPAKGNRVSISELPDFPESSIMAEAFDLSKRDSKEIDKIYKEMAEAVKNPDDSTPELVLQLRARQKVELLKVPLLVELINTALDEDKSVVVFVSFRETLSKLQQDYPAAAVVCGEQSQLVRDSMIAKFQADDTRVCLCTIQAGGLSISLHDLKGDHPRVSILTPTFNAVDLKQALGRVHRAGGKSKSLQYIVFAANTIEEHVCKSVRRKLKQIASLNDGDLALDQIDVSR